MKNIEQTRLNMIGKHITEAIEMAETYSYIVHEHLVYKKEGSFNPLRFNIIIKDCTVIDVNMH